jgi:hypothetical protein
MKLRIRLMSERLVSLALWLIAGCEAPNATGQTPGAFTTTGNMTTARSGHTATLLQNGKVLIAGGGSAVLELYDPSTGTFTATGARTARENVGSATLLLDGRVLLIETGTQTDGSDHDEITYTRNAELYDPVAGTVSATGGMIEYQTNYTATLLTNGKVLITGGLRVSGCCGAAADPELFDPSTQLFSDIAPYADTGASLSTPGGADAGVIFSAAASLANGKVLVTAEPAAELYDPLSGTFTLTASALPALPSGAVFVDGQEATLLANGSVLLTGGDPSDFDCGFDVRANAEVYDPVAGTFRSTGSMALPRLGPTATLLPDGTVLIMGGVWPSGGIHLAELYNPGTGAFSATGDMISDRVLQQATLLADGRVLITGGLSIAHDFSSITTLATAELYTPAVLTPAPRLFSLSGDGTGQGAIWHSQTGQPASAADPAVAGEILSMYTTSLMDGAAIPPEVSIGGSPSEVLYFGASSFPGYYQVNVRVPSSVATGDSVPVRLTYIGRSSNAVAIGVR